MTATAVKYLSPSESGRRPSISIGFREISDTPGLGLKAKEDPFRTQYDGKSASELTVVRAAMRATPRSMRSAVQRLHPTQ